MLWLPLPDRLAKHTLNMAGFKVRHETRTTAPAWLDSVQARVPRDTHSSRCGPAPALCPPPPSCSNTHWRSSEQNHHVPKHLCNLLLLTPLYLAGRPDSADLKLPHHHHTHHFRTGPHSTLSPSQPSLPHRSPSQSALPHTCPAHLQAAPRGQRALFPPATPLSSSSAPLVILKAFQRMLSGLDVVWLGCLFSYWRFYDRIGNEP